jgi:hypothetical protein
MKHSVSWGFYLLLELYDSAGVLLFREDKMHYVSVSHDNLPPFVIEPGKSVPGRVAIMPCSGFGALPPGKYSVRAYFPFEKGTYYPSNAVGFEIGEEAMKEKK